MSELVKVQYRHHTRDADGDVVFFFNQCGEEPSRSSPIKSLKKREDSGNEFVIETQNQNRCYLVNLDDGTAAHLARELSDYWQRFIGVDKNLGNGPTPVDKNLGNGPTPRGDATAQADDSSKSKSARELEWDGQRIIHRWVDEDENHYLVKGRHCNALWEKPALQEALRHAGIVCNRLLTRLRHYLDFVVDNHGRHDDDRNT